MNYYYSPNHSVVNYINDYCSNHNFKKILEIGPGINYFNLATHFVDYIYWNNQLADKTTICDVSKSKLPFTDEEFDFVYCRHVVEDMYNPFLLLDEMKRISKSGYIETPSPIIELSRNVDFYGKCTSTLGNYRGYSHHRYICSNVDGTLNLITKYPIIEYHSFSFDKIKDLLYDCYHWNTYYLWNRNEGNDLTYKYYELDIDFKFINTRNALLDNNNRPFYVDKLVDLTNKNISFVENFKKKFIC